MRVVQHPWHLPAASLPALTVSLGELFCYSFYAVATILLHLYAILPLIIADLNYNPLSGCRQP